jgi:hypothetical protein|nr:MAG TPA: DNA pilot protein VP2 [Microviridae sp. ctiGb4]
MAVVEALVAGIGGAFNSIFQGRQNRKNREFQERENQINRQFAVDMWNKQNEYNLPTNQMQRLRDAGINPHLAYSNGQPMNTSNAPATPSGVGSLPQGIAPQMNIGEIFNALMTKAQIKQMEAQTEKTLAEKEEVEARTEGIGKDNQVKDIELTHKEREILANIGVTEGQIDIIKSNLETAKINDDKLRKEIENIEANTAKTKQEKENLEKNLVLIGAQVLNILEDTELKKAQRGLVDIQKGNVQQQTKLLLAQTGIAQTEQRYKAREIEAAINEAKMRLKKIGVDIGHIQHQELSSIIGALLKYVRDGYNTMDMSSLP